MSDPLWFTTTDGLPIGHDEIGTETSRPQAALHLSFAATAFVGTADAIAEFVNR